MPYAASTSSSSPPETPKFNESTNSLGCFPLVNSAIWLSCLPIKSINSHALHPLLKAKVSEVMQTIQTFGPLQSVNLDLFKGYYRNFSPPAKYYSALTMVMRERENSDELSGEKSRDSPDEKMEFQERGIDFLGEKKSKSPDKTKIIGGYDEMDAFQPKRGGMNFGSQELTLSYLCENSKLGFPEKDVSGQTLLNSLDKLSGRYKGKEIVVSEDQNEEGNNNNNNNTWVERDFLQLNENRGNSSKREAENVEFDGENREKKPKVESLNLSLALPDVSLSLAGSNRVPNGDLPSRLRPSRSVQSLGPSYNNTQTTYSNDYTAASLSHSYSHAFSHNPSCSLTRVRPRTMTTRWEVIEGSVIRYGTVGRGPMVRSIAGLGQSEMGLLRSRPRMDAQSGDSRRRNNLESLRDSEDVDVIIQELTDETVESVKEYLRNIIDDPETKDELAGLQRRLERRSDLTNETLSNWVGCDACSHWCHAACGLHRNLIKPSPCLKGSSGATEMQFHCLGCGHASEMFGFVKEVFMSCAKDWGLENLIKELDCVRKIFAGSEDRKGRELHVKADEMLSKLQNKMITPPEVCNSIFQFFNCYVIKGDRIAVLVVKRFKNGKRKCLEDNINDVTTDNYLDISSSSMPSKDLTDQPSFGIDASALPLSNSLTPKPSFYNMNSSSGRQESSTPFDLYHNDIKVPLMSDKIIEDEWSVKPTKKDGFDSLASLVRIKEAEARMFQSRADEARTEIEGFRRMVRLKTEKLDEEYAEKLAKLCLQETEERRRKKLEELKVLENSHCDYYKMKIRMQSEISGLLKRMEATKQQLV
ncbi:hypothetical protein DH2020_020547 [Rehmannia glutinosa]|uniref:Uncharacterized protein n=1 Tax=Rehmannia glutinosa TaxID=99300 RepID=A0ABR0WGD3_REHGL